MQGNEWKVYKKRQHRYLKNCFPLFTYQGDKRPIQIPLLLLFSRDWSQAHFVIIRNLSSFLRSDTGNKKYVCLRCFQNFSSDRTLNDHEKYCIPRMSVTSFPKEKVLKFNNWHHTIETPFSYSFDSGSYLEKCKENDRVY